MIRFNVGHIWRKVQPVRSQAHSEIEAGVFRAVGATPLGVWRQSRDRRDFARLWYQPVAATIWGVRIGNSRLATREQLDCGPQIGTVPAGALRDRAALYARLTQGACQPQLAALVFGITARYQALDGYFPLTRTLDARELEQFHDLIAEVATDANLDVRLIGELRIDCTEELPAEVRAIVAGHLAEIFFYRRDILSRLLGTPRQFRLYTSGLAFAEDGRVAGGDYDPQTGRVGLLLSRLVEGFYGPTPGVAPFLHELGHMLDYFDAARGDAARHGSGFLPGMRPEDGALYTPEARALFVRGKRLELERYLRLWHGRGTPSTPLPIGSPYVFQNDSEFLAGYLEMFFRNPHYFAAQNPDLYQAFVSLFRQDPRRAWVEDFPFYVEENRDFYLRAPRRPPPPGLFLPAA